MHGTLYAWTSAFFTYVGKVQDVRAGALSVTGTVVRWVRDHLRFALRPVPQNSKRQEAKSRRYKLAKRATPGTWGMCAARRGPTPQISVMETLSINGLDSNANEKKKKGHRGPRQPRLRTGAGQKARKGRLKAKQNGNDMNDVGKHRSKFRGILDTDATLEAAEEAQKRWIKELKGGKGAAEEEKWALKFSQAYSQT